MSYIEIKDVDLHYGRQTGADNGTGTLALANANLTIGENEFIAVVGPSGCGKSTLLKLISGLVRPTRGIVRVGGQDVKKPLKSVGMAFQNSTLLPWRNVRDNVLLPLEIVEPYRSEPKTKMDEKRKRADELLATVGLADFGDKMPWQLSGGMQQRAQLCRALIHEPSILLLDEPFGALDAFTREELWAVLQNLWMTRKCTVVLVTHELREAVYLCDTVYVVSPRPGRIIASSKVPFARPRTLDMTFQTEFVDLVHACRHHIMPGNTA
ncbi:MAG TPA: ABC transporter ATP-binding protein [Pseudolabrys sp.]|jgi:NitT/TauT family transport system ATP-binding protein|nr:ABC transporter ATP-binding protein [Pseudolabrys sp.]